MERSHWNVTPASDTVSESVREEDDNSNQAAKASAYSSSPPANSGANKMPLTEVPSASAEVLRRRRTNRPVRSVNIRGVPEQVWKRARHNALTSMMSFRHYMIRVLAESQPFLATESETNDEPGDVEDG